MMRVFVGGQPLRKKGDEIEPPYVNIAGQQTQYKSFYLRNFVFSLTVLFYFTNLFLFLATIVPFM